MTKSAEIEIQELAEDYQDIGDDDYGFIFDSEGNLKYAFIPEIVPNRPPKNIARFWVLLI
jgi:hypothetical protein